MRICTIPYIVYTLIIRYSEYIQFEYPHCIIPMITTILMLYFTSIIAIRNCIKCICITNITLYDNRILGFVEYASTLVVTALKASVCLSPGKCHRRVLCVEKLSLLQRKPDDCPAARITLINNVRGSLLRNTW